MVARLVSTAVGSGSGVVDAAIVESGAVEVAAGMVDRLVAAVVGGDGAGVVGTVGVAVGALEAGGRGVEVQSLALSVIGAAPAGTGGGSNRGGGSSAAVRSSANDQPSNVPGGGRRLPAPNVL